jgi:thioesterase domain-containing protein
VFGAGQVASIASAAVAACAAAEPLRIVGHSMGGATAVEVALALFRQGFVPSNLITIDPFSPSHAAVPAQVRATNFLQRESLLAGSYLYGDNVRMYAIASWPEGASITGRSRKGCGRRS